MDNPGQGSGSKGLFQTPFGITGSTNPVPVEGWSSQTPTAKTFDYGNATSAFDAGYSKDDRGAGVFDGPAETLKNNIRGESK